MFTFPARAKDIASFLSTWTLRVVCIGIAFVVVLLAEKKATAQNRAPDKVFERAEQREETGVDTHFGPTVD